MLPDHVKTGRFRLSDSNSYASTGGRSFSETCACVEVVYESKKVSLIKSIGEVEVFSSPIRIVDLRQIQRKE